MLNKVFQCAVFLCNPDIHPLMNSNSSLSAYFTQLQTQLEANSRTTRQQMDHQEHTIKELIEIVISLLEQQKTSFGTLKAAIVQLCQPLQQYYPSLNVSEQARVVLDGQESTSASLEAESDRNCRLLREK